MASTEDIIDLIKELIEDDNVTKNLKVKLGKIITILSSDEDLSIKLNKASHELDELASNSDLDSFTRTQLMGVIGALETVEK